MKQDDLSATVAGVQEFFLTNQQKITKFGGIAALAVAVVVGGLWISSSRQTRASDEFATALATYHAVVSETKPDKVAGFYFKTDKERYEEALKKFQAVASSYSWTSTGKYARYYAALCERGLGNNSQAEKDLNEVAGSDETGSLARMALAGVYEQSGRAADAEKIYRDLKDHPTTTVPASTANIALAELLQKTKPAEAKAIFQQLEKDYSGKAAGDIATKALQGSAQ